MKKSIILFFAIFSVCLSASAYRIINNTPSNIWVSLLNDDDAIWAEHDFMIPPGQIIDHPMPNAVNQKMFFEISNLMQMHTGDYFSVNSTIVVTENAKGDRIYLDITE